ncbi:MAG: NAD/NADP octopine/nopaline dehydrogenase, alpha-helical domain [Firmicutes bacterium ADurb.Bin354]|nr:MAG: NAD/NADP octopine/nopaline dehydrogenase, alpha-helical domain [Firmicutes bacterium ADurb.Bin354]
MLSDYHEGKVYDRLPLFYGEWDESSSELLLNCDEEVQLICRSIGEFDLSGVKSLKEHYGASDVRSMTDKLRSIKSLNNLPTPVKRVDGGVIPDFSSRYFEADFPYGLAVVNEIAKLVGADVPEIRATLEWYEDLTHRVKDVKMTSYHEFSLAKCGIRSYKDLIDFYR